MSTLKVTNIQHGSATNVAMVLDTAGTVKAYSTISVGNVTPSSSGAGITFPATASASSDANTLDDYEEGTFTPVLSRDTTASTISYGSREGKYTKVGNLVTIQVTISNITVSGAGSGSNIMTGLPFGAASGISYFGAAPLSFNDAFTNTVSRGSIASNNATTMYFVSGTRSSSYETGGWSSGGFLSLTFSYMTS